MTVAVTHSAVATLPDQAGAEINKAEWNAAHVVTGLGALALVDTVTSTQISDATAVGKSVLTAADAAAARTAIGAGTGSGTVTAVSGTSPIASSGGATPAISLNDGGVTYAKIQNVSVTSRFLGRITASAGSVEELTAANAKTILAIASTDVSGLGTLATQSGTFSGNSSGTNTGDQTITLTTDVTGSGVGSFVATIAAAAVTLAKMANRATQTFIGRNTAGSGVPEELSIATAKTMLNLTGTNSGDQTITLTTDVTGSGSGSFAATISANAVTDAKFRQSGARSVVGVTGNATANTADIVGTTDQVLRVSGAGTALAFGAIDLSKTAAASGVLQAVSFPALTGDVTTVSGALATTIGATKVTRAMLNAATDGTGGRNWAFLGQATASNAVRTGTITWTGTFKQLWFEYFISGYSGSAIGRLIVGPTAGLSETGTTFCTSLIEGVTLTATSVSVPGWPTATTAGAVARFGHMYVQNTAGVVKRMTGHGQHSGTAPTVVPTQMRMAGMFNDATNLINKAELAVYDAITGAAISATTFNAGTFLNVWGRNDD